MKHAVRVGLIGDHDDRVTAHRAIPRALELAAAAIDADVRWQWVPTDEIDSIDRLPAFDGLWCVPASPYRSTEGALLAIRHARQAGRPFLGTCGGFQHVILEYARNVLGWTDADHAETASDTGRLVISPLACALVETTSRVRFVRGSRIAAAYGAPGASEGYRCSYGLNPEFRDALVSGPLRVSADDATGEVRAVELDGHPFFVATLFQPERAALEGRVPPLVAAFLRSVGTAPGSDATR